MTTAKQIRPYDAVLFDFGHTLFTTKPGAACTSQFREAHGKNVDEAAFAEMWRSIRQRSLAPEEMAKGRDLSAASHRRCWLDLLAPMDQLAEGLAEFTYELESSARGWEPYPDALAVLTELSRREIRVAVVSDCGWDIRPAFTEHGLGPFVGSFALSFEHRVCKPAPAIFELACHNASVSPERAVMVGDNALTDGGAAAIGIATLILPARDRVGEPALSHVLDLVG